MIRLERGPMPAYFDNDELLGLQGKVHAFFSRPARLRAQEKFDFERPMFGFVSELRRISADRFPPKCAYCESPLRSPDVDAFRPHRHATNLDGSIDDDHYWWLAFDWGNYLPACPVCKRLKGARFPVHGPRAAVGSRGDRLKSERRLLLDPCEDHPEEVLLFLDDGRVSSEDERGRVTIDVLDLNRSALIEARLSHLRLFLAMLPAFDRAHGPIEKVGMLNATAIDKPFAAMRRQYAKAWALDVLRRIPELESDLRPILAYKSAFQFSLFERRPEITKASTGLSSRIAASESFSVEEPGLSTDYYRKTRFIERIELKNIRVFESLDLSLPVASGERGAWYMLLGENGSGKSSILQAVACALAGQAGAKRLGIRPSDLLRRGAAKGEVRVHVSGLSTPVTMVLRRRDDSIAITPSTPKVMTLAYGATRLLSSGKAAKRDTRIHVKNLFDPHAVLNDGHPWLFDAPKAEFDRYARALSSLLPRSDGVRFRRRNGRIHVEAPGIRDTLDGMSSGYQAVLALAIDIISVMRLGWQDMATAEGIVLIDEVDAHLHPRWKMRIVQRLREVFPRMQFIATSHEPLTLSGLERDEVAVLKRDLDGKVRALTSVDADFPSPKLMRIDQLLTSDFFGLNTTEGFEVDALFDEYYGLLAVRERDPLQTQRLAELRGMLERDQRLGLTPREQIVYAAADRFLAERKTEQAGLSSDVRDAALHRLQRLWSDDAGGEA
jgi:predicted ATPase